MEIEMNPTNLFSENSSDINLSPSLQGIIDNILSDNDEPLQTQSEAERDIGNNVMPPTTTTGKEASGSAQDGSTQPHNHEDTRMNAETNRDPLLYPRNVEGTSAPPKRKLANPCTWKKVIKKQLREQGKEYSNYEGKKVGARKVKPPKCGSACYYNCTSFFSEDMRKKINSDFWALNEGQKKFFYAKFVQVVPKKRLRTKKESSRRSNTFKYSFEFHGQQYQVCQSFFMATLDITKSRIYYYFKLNHNSITGSPMPLKKNNPAKNKTPTDKTLQIKKHIESFPCIDSHYVRASSQKQYLQAGLNLRKMYNLYKETTEDPLKFCMYRSIFTTQYNISFYKPKKDQCDACTKFENVINPSANEIIEYQEHKRLNANAKVRRQADRELKDTKVAVISYDLQSVFSMPVANISNFYYKRKFSMYNLTGLCNLNKTTYCSLWYESQSGRSGNDIASALIRILRAVLEDNPDVTKIILWSDSCIPQNRNRLTSLALLKFLETSPQIEMVTQRFSSGHSRIQELDAVHSVIDRHLKNISYFSPISLMRNLKSMDYPNIKLKLMQLNQNDFYNYSIATQGLNFIPYTKCKEIIYEQTKLLQIKYREDYGEDIISTAVYLVNEKKLRSKKKQRDTVLPKVSKTTIGGLISKEKKSDIESMFKWMPMEDVQFYKAILK